MHPINAPLHSPSPLPSTRSPSSNQPAPSPHLHTPTHHPPHPALFAPLPLRQPPDPRRLRTRLLSPIQNLRHHDIKHSSAVVGSLGFDLGGRSSWFKKRQYGVVSTVCSALGMGVMGVVVLLHQAVGGVGGGGCEGGENCRANGGWGRVRV
ncbi:hypothetical protein BCR34DRAFT_141280 [Clohesyomyces aquaticus]|uniref:Uncharacterized protein n=1 Tax=Clohesyomyces aquaticus TaxID=1231657 RepID=A0A1Y1YMD4_9PLEO|nr:hypothetical protein BCR34DRAFT_141280 [Clohesyomyces aquaticus]